jgi:hypothetical protein
MSKTQASRKLLGPQSLDENQWGALEEETEGFDVNEMACWNTVDMTAVVTITGIQLKSTRLAGGPKKNAANIEVSGLGSTTPSNDPNKDKNKLCSAKSEEVQPRERKRNLYPMTGLMNMLTSPWI